MKKQLFVSGFLALVSLVLLGCTQQAVECRGPPIPTYACLDGRVVTSLAECPQQPPQQQNCTPTQGLPEPEQEEQAPSLPDEIVDAFDKARDTTKSMQYKFQGPPNPKDVFGVLWKGNKMKVLRPQYANYLEIERYDTVFLDLENQTAVAYCLEYDIVCRDKAKAFYPGFQTYLYKTPFDWMDEIEGGTIEGSEQINGRYAWRLEYGQGSSLHTVWIDQHYGLPIKVQIGQPTKDIAGQQGLTTYEYKELGVNSVEDQEVRPA